MRPCLLALALASLPAVVAPLSRAEAQEAAAPVAARKQRPPQAAIDRAIDRGVEWLLARQELDGSWAYKPDEYPAGQTGLCVFTLLKCGLRGDHPAVRRALAFLAAQPVEHTYAASMLLLALSAHDTDSNEEWIEEVVEKLVGWQTGGWAYPALQVDLSNTQLAALALRYAALAGVDVDRKVWTELATAMQKHQTDDGGFSYHLGDPPTGSMTAAGIAVLAIVRERLDASGRLAPQLARTIEAANERGLAWLATHFSAEENPEPSAPARLHDRWLYYWLYGLERVGALLATDVIGERDWYAEGAAFLVGAQDAQGGWRTPPGEMEPNTCFALLFLRRATAPRTGEREPYSGRAIWGYDDPRSDVSLRAVGDGTLELWISSWGDALRATYEWPGEEGKGPRVAAVEYLADGELVHRRGHDPSRPAGDERFPHRVTFETRGEHTLGVRVLVVPPGAEPGKAEDLVAVESPELDVRVSAILEDWMMPYALDAGRNELARTKAAVEASSLLRAGFQPENAVDGFQTRGWLCAEADLEPTLVIELARPVRGDTLMLTHTRGDPTRPGLYARASEVEVTVNGRKPVTVRMDPDEQRKTLVPLGRTENVRRLELRVRSRVPGTAQKAACGFAEVELVRLPKDDPRGG